MLREKFSNLPEDTKEPENTHSEEIADGSLKTRLQLMRTRFGKQMRHLRRDLFERMETHEIEGQENGLGRYGSFYFGQQGGWAARHEGADLLRHVALNITTASSALNGLSRHANYEVRLAVAENEGTSPETLLELANDPHLDVRYAVAENYNAPQPVLAALVDDENPYVASRARKTLQRLSGGTVIRGLFDQSEGVARFFGTGTR